MRLLPWALLVCLVSGCVTPVNVDPEVPLRDIHRLSDDELVTAISDTKHRRYAPASNVYITALLEEAFERNPDWSAEVRKRIANQAVWLNMTKLHLLLSRGRPSDVNRSIGSWGVHEQWVYRGWIAYLEDGILTSLQD